MQVIHHSVSELLRMMENMQIEHSTRDQESDLVSKPPSYSGLHIKVNATLGLLSTFICKGPYVRQCVLQSAGYRNPKPCPFTVLMVVIRSDGSKA